MFFLKHIAVYIYKKSKILRKKFYNFFYLPKLFKKFLFFKLAKKKSLFLMVSNSKNNFFFLFKNIHFKPFLYFSYGMLLKFFFLFKKNFKKKKKFFATFAKFFKQLIRSANKRVFLIFKKIIQKNFIFLKNYFLYKINPRLKYLYFIFKYKIFHKKKISFIKKKIKKRLK